MSTKFAFEVPLKHLKDFEDLQDFHFTLSMLYDQECYTDYLKGVKSKGLSTLWLDNSFNEKFIADSVGRLTELFHEWHPQRVISPDSPEWSTDQIATEYLIMRRYIVNERILVVVRNPDMYDVLKKAGAVNFAASYWVRAEGFTSTEMRYIENLHLLGFLNPSEIQQVKPASCDTSMPVKLALIKTTINEWALNGCPHINTKDLGLAGEDFWNTHMDPETIRLARDNIKRLKEVCEW